MSNKVPASVDEVFAKAARMSRVQRGATASPLPDNGALDLSLAAVAQHARHEKNAAGRGADAGPAAAAADTGVAPAPAAYKSPTLFVEPVPVPARPSMPSPAKPAEPVVAADIACQSEVIAALHENVQDEPRGPGATAGAAVVDKLAAATARWSQLAASALGSARNAAVRARARLGAAVHAVRMARLPKLPGLPRLPRFPRLPRLPRRPALPPLASWAATRWQGAASTLSTHAAAARARVSGASGPVRAHPRRAAAATAAVVLGVGLLVGVGQLRRDAVGGREAVVATAPAPVPVAQVAKSAADVPVAAPAVVPAKPAPAPAPVPVGGPQYGLVTELGDAGNTALAEQLLGASRAGGAGGNNDVSTAGWLAALAALAKQPRVAVLRYDALQAARNAPSSARVPALEVLAPLTLEPIYAVVRADSPLRFVHDMQGKAINAGAAQSSRALTVNTLYRGLFGAQLPAHPLRAQDEAAALESLGAGKLDVVVLIGSASGAWFANLLAAQSAQFKLLAFDPAQAGGQKAVNSFLPVRAQPHSLGVFPTVPTPTLGVMSFLVTAQPSTAANTNNGADDSDFRQQALANLTADLCSGRSKANVLPTFQRVDPTLKLDVGWPYSDAAQRLLSRCGGTSTVARTPTAGSS